MTLPSGQSSLDQLSRDSQRLRALVSHAPVCVHELAPNGTVVAINPAGLELLGLDDPAMILGQPVEAAVAPADLPTVKEAIAKAMAGEMSQFSFELMSTRGGVHCASWLYPLKDEGGKITRLLGISHDISTGQAALQALAESEQRYRQMFETNLAVKFILDPETACLVEVNQAACRFYGYSREELVGMSIERINIMPLEAVREQMRMAVASKKLSFEFRHRLKSGEIRDVEVFSGPVDTPEGTRLYSIVHDITDRKQAERRLLASEQRFARAVRGTTGGIWEWNVDDDTVYWSLRFKELLGYQDEEIPNPAGMLWRLMHPQDVAMTMDRIRRHLDHGEPYDLRYRLRHKDGDYRWFRVRGVLERDATGARIMSGSIEEITELVEEEERARARRHRILRQNRAALALATDPELNARNLDASFARLTETACQVLQVDRASLVLLNEDRTRLLSQDLYVPAKGEHFRGFVHEVTELPRYLEILQRSRVIAAEDAAADSRLAEFPSAFFAERGIQSMLDIPMRRHGELVGILRLSTLSPLRHWTEDEIQFGLDLADFAVRLLVDTEALAARRQQRELETRILEAQKLESLGLMASGIAHDFNNLLVTILGNADIAQAELPADSRASEQVAAIEQAARRAADLCRQMLAYSGSGLLRMETCDLNYLVGETIQLLRPSLPQQVEILFDREQEAILVSADPTQLRQVVMNLLVNAAEAMPEEGGQVELTVDVAHLEVEEQPIGLSVANAGPYAQLRIRDNGCGMDQLVLARLFDPFFSTKFTGRGLGLAATLGIMRAHGGGIRVSSRPQEGSCFELAFPLASAEAHCKAEAEPPLDATWKGDGAVLVVDDDDTVRLLAKEMLERLGFRPQLVATGEAALEALQQPPPGGWRLVLLDLTMPGMSGADVLQRIRAEHPGMPVLMSSGYAKDELDKELREGAAFLGKPYTMAELGAAMRQLLEA